jgi:hypothetical protein
MLPPDRAAVLVVPIALVANWQRPQVDLNVLVAKIAVRTEEVGESSTHPPPAVHNLDKSSVRHATQRTHLELTASRFR